MVNSVGDVIQLYRGDHVEQAYTDEIDAHDYIDIVIYGNIYNDAVVDEVSIESN
jgi:hypothetical protein